MRVLQLIDSLQAGGAERVAVNYANALVTHIDKSFLCTTRAQGPLLKLIDQEVGYLFLGRKKTVDIKALLKLKMFIKEQKIDIVHAHGTSFFIATQLKILGCSSVIIWHNHSFYSPTLSIIQRLSLRFCAQFFNLIFCVNPELEHWSKKVLNHKKVYYIKNFVAPQENLNDSIDFQGVMGKRIVCVANFRPVKNHGLLLDAFSKIVKKDPQATLHLFGSEFGDIYAQAILHIINDLPNVYYHGMHEEVSSILPCFDIGVLSSDSEGLPLALLEYGQAGLPVVVTDVGQCKDVINGNGSVVEPGDTKSFGDKISNYLNDPEAAKRVGLAFQRQILDNYSVDTILPEVLKIYEQASQRK